MDRKVPHVAWKLRRAFGDFDKSLGKWISDPAQPRFLVYEDNVCDVNSKFVFVVDVNELVAVIAERYAAAYRACRSLQLMADVAPDVMDILCRLQWEIGTIVDDAQAKE